MAVFASDSFEYTTNATPLDSLVCLSFTIVTLSIKTTVTVDRATLTQPSYLEILP
jgi:hypothetical protein